MNVLGIDIGGTGIKGAPVNTVDGVLLAERLRIPTPNPATPEAVAEVVKEIVHHFEWTGHVGCTIPARVEHGLVRTAANIHKGWIDTQVDSLFSGVTGCRVTVLNDADAAGIASMRFGAGRSLDGLVFFITVGTGIGSAMFYNQQLIPNTELGHLRLKGMAAEEYASNRVREQEGLTWKKWARRFQKYLDRIEFLFAPDTIIISRPAKVAEYWSYLSTRAELRPAELENEAGIIGAAAAAI
ncbi:MAG: ROK family protein [Bacteroidetes bacterium]|nr:ROK family protein [Bacteroidota bacterium]